MQRDALLTQDELDFIQTMQHNPQLNLRDASSSLTVNGGRRFATCSLAWPPTTMSPSRRSSTTSNSRSHCTWSKMSFTRFTCAWACRVFSKTAR